MAFYPILQKLRIPAAILFVLLLLYVYAAAGPAGNGPARLMQQTSDAIDELLARSPGERDEIAVAKGKGKAKGKAGTFASNEVPAGRPTQRALGQTFQPPVEDVADEPILAAVPVDEPLIAAAAPDVLAPGGFFPLAPIGGGLIGGGGGGGAGGGGGGGGGTPPPPPPPPSAIPEPSTWALMIFGFMATGAALRRRNRLAARHA